MGLMKIVLTSTIIASSLFVTSCGDKKKNKVNTNAYTNGAIMVGTNPYSVNGANPAVSQAIAQIEGQYPCTTGQRIYKQFNSRQVSGTATTISAQFADGAIAGTATAPGSIYVGLNYTTRDLLYIEKVTSGTSVVGFNATLSFCPYPNVISADRNLTNLTINANLDTDAHCGVGSIDAASTFVLSVKDQSQPGYYFGCSGGSTSYPQNPYMATYGICTNFTKVSCNGRY